MGIWVVATVCSGVIVSWTKLAVKALDIKTREMLTVYSTLLLKASIYYLYMKWDVGGRGVVYVSECVTSERGMLNCYFVTSEKDLLKFMFRRGKYQWDW